MLHRKRTFEFGLRSSILAFMLVLVASGCWAIGPGDSIVVLYVEFPGGHYEVGTGVFVDHDGLILTADHVIHQSALSPPRTFVVGTIPTQVQPSKITAFSAQLHAPLNVDLGTVIGGTLSSSRWMDVAFIRATLTPNQRAAIQPIDVSTTAPSQTEQLTAWGPRCVDMSNPALNCGAPESVTLTLSSNPYFSPDYNVRANLKKGYSGGPLINSSNNVVGIASWGDGPDGAGTSFNQIVDATYVPSTFIVLNFGSKLIASNWLTGTQGCTNTQSLPSLTLFDMDELFPERDQHSPTPEQCSCCCRSLPRAPNALNSRITQMPCQQLAECSQQLIFAALARSVQLDAITGSVDASTASNYLQLREMFAAINPSRLPSGQQAELYDSLGSTSAALSTNFPSTSSAFATAPQDALFAYKMRSRFGDTPQMYFNLSHVYAAEGDSARAADATLLGTMVTVRQEDIDQTQPDIGPLRKQVFDAAPKGFPSAITFDKPK